MTTIERSDPPGGSIKVDVDGLADIAHDLRVEIDKHLRPYVADLLHAYKLGVNVGNGVASPNMLAARLQYRDCLAAIINQLNAFVRGGMILADAADIIAKQYDDSDALTAASIASVNDALRAAGSANPADPQLPTTESVIIINGHRVV